MKIKISKTFFVLFIFFIVFYDYKQLFAFLLALFLHEISHLILALKYKLKIESFNITPFGVYCIINDIEFLSIHKKIKITIIGIVTNIVFFLCFYLLSSDNLILKYFTYYNLFLAIFNLLPIYPLDGSKLFIYIHSYFFGYMNSAKIIIWLGKNITKALILFGFILTILYTTNIYIYLFGIYLYRKQTSDIYTKLYYDFYKSLQKKYKLKKTLKVKTLYINKESTLTDLFKYYSYDNFLTFVFNDENMIFDFTEYEIFLYMENSPLSTKIGTLIINI